MALASCRKGGTENTATQPGNIPAKTLSFSAKSLSGRRESNPRMQLGKMHTTATRAAVVGKNGADNDNYRKERSGKTLGLMQNQAHFIRIAFNRLDFRF